jgi:hypothetical protein
MTHQKKSYFIVLIAIFSILISGNIGLSQNKDPLPQTIIKNMAERYVTVSSYQDTGVVETVTGGPLPTRSTDIFFKTYFTRPGKLRFEWTDYTILTSPEKNVVWSDGLKTFRFYTYEPEKIESEEDIGMGIAGATGLSRGAAHTVPGLLIKEIGGFSLTDLMKLSLNGQERFEGEDCFIVEGFHPNGEAWQMWISKKDFLLRKLRIKGSDGEFKEEIHRDIQIGAEILEAVYHPKIAGGRIKEGVARDKEESIRRLLELMMPRDRFNQMLKEVLSLLKTAMPRVPEKIWQEVITELKLNADTMLQIYVPIYDEHYTSDEIKQLITLYESPFGQKIRRNSDLIETGAARRGEMVGRELIKRIEEKLKSKGYSPPTT